MKPYNVEIFDRDMNYVSNTLVESVKYKEDYLDPEKYKVDLYDVHDVKKNYFIHIMRDAEDYIGIISQIDEKREGLTTVTVSEVSSIFNVDIMIDVDDMTGSLEQYMKDWIDSLFVSGDSKMKMPFDVKCSSTTSNWAIDYKIENEADEDEPTPPVRVSFLNLFNDLILPAFASYQVRIDYSIDLNKKKIVLDIGKNTNASFVIESELPNVLSKKVIIKNAKNVTNKAIIYNEEDYRQSLTYYLHPDDTFDLLNSSRVTPVEYKLLKAKKSTETYFTYKYNGVEYENREDAVAAAKAAGQSSTAVEKIEHIVVTKTFEEAAYEKALATFTKNKYTNLIELEFFMDDYQINPVELKIGQVVSVLSDGVFYSTILTGKEISNTIKLIFGTVRLELTKLLKGRA